MALRNWFRSLLSQTDGRRRQPPRVRSCECVLQVESLEDRAVPALSVIDDIAIETLPANVRLNQDETGNMLKVSVESQGRTLAQALAVDVIDPGASGPEQFVGAYVVGAYGASDSYPRSGTLSAGMIVNSYLVRFDPADQGTPADGWLVFTNERIVGIIAETATLYASNSALGQSSVLYPQTHEEDFGLEITSKPNADGNRDALIITSPNQIRIALMAGYAQDLVRVITVYDPPELPNQPFEISEAAADGALVGVVDADPSQTGDTLTYSILAGNTSGAFAIDASTGALTIANASLFDHESNPEMVLLVQVTDQRGNSDSGSVVVTIENAAPSTPLDVDAAVNLPFVTAGNGEPIGVTIAAVDPHGGSVVYALTDDAGGRFAIHATSGVITIANSSLLAANSEYTVTAQASDGHGGLSTATFTIFAVSLPSATPASYTAQGDAFFALGLYAEANYLYGVVIEMTPTEPTIYEKRGNALLALGQLNDAVYAYTVSANLAPTNAAIWVKLGQAQIANNQLSAGIYSLSVAVGLSPTNALYRLHLGEAQYLGGLFNDAEYSFLWAMTYDPLLADYIYDLYGDLF